MQIELCVPMISSKTRRQLQQFASRVHITMAHTIYMDSTGSWYVPM